MVAIQILFQMIQAPDYLSLAEARAYALENGNDPEEGYNAKINPYLDQLIQGVMDQQDELDQMIQANLENWSLDRLNKIDLTILRLALYEMFFIDDQEVPKVVAVDEAIELSKGFSDDKSRQFISGILMKILNQQTNFN